MPDVQTNLAVAKEGLSQALYKTHKASEWMSGRVRSYRVALDAVSEAFRAAETAMIALGQVRKVLQTVSKDK